MLLTNTYLYLSIIQQVFFSRKASISTYYFLKAVHQRSQGSFVLHVHCLLQIPHVLHTCLASANLDLYFASATFPHHTCFSYYLYFPFTAYAVHVFLNRIIPTILPSRTKFFLGIFCKWRICYFNNVFKQYNVCTF